MVGFYALCLISIVGAYLGSVILVALLGFANVTAIAGALLGDEAAVSILQLLGNILFAVLAGFFMTESYKSAMRDVEGDIALVALGTVTILALTFGFPAFASSYLPSLVEWMTTDGAGLPAVLALSFVEAFVGGTAIAALGAMQPAGK